VSFDNDFVQLELLRGFPPKVIHLRFGNSSTEQVAQTLLNNLSLIQQFIDSDEFGVLEIY
jgi:predicted nuclease of predicted toxin-antitoxin system